jgi:hypothetical protein
MAFPILAASCANNVVLLPPELIEAVNRNTEQTPKAESRILGVDMAPPRASNEQVANIAERRLTRHYRSSSAVLMVVGRDPDL